MLALVPCSQLRDASPCLCVACNSHFILILFNIFFAGPDICEVAETSADGDEFAFCSNNFVGDVPCTNTDPACVEDTRCLPYDLKQ